MLHVVQFSGGAASAWVAKWVADTYGKENTKLLYHSTKAEHADADRFRTQTSHYIGVPITEVSDGRSLWEVIEDEHCLPSQFIPFCTRILKQEPAEKYLKQLEADGIKYTLYNGMGIEEWRRVQKATVRAEALGRKLVCPLFDLKISNQQVKDEIRNKWRICLPEPYKYLEHNNCIPCFKAGKSHWHKVWKYYQERFKKAKEMEELIGHTVFKDVSLLELEKQWEQTKGQVTFSEWENESIPCMCAV